MRPTKLLPAVSSALALAASLLASPLLPPAGAQMLQLDPVAPKYTLLSFEYLPPKDDGWRQVANSTQTLQLVYAEHSPDDQAKIDTRFAVVMEVAEIPPGTEIPSPSYLAELSRKQQAEKPERKELIKGVSPIIQTPGLPHIFTYRFLVKTPEGAAEAEAYDVFYVTTSPDEKQYLVINLITKEKDYENKLYFQQFLASLPSLQYKPASQPAAAAPAAPAGTDKPAAAAPAPDAKPADKPAEKPASEGAGH